MFVTVVVVGGSASAELAEFSSDPPVKDPSCYKGILGANMLECSSDTGCRYCCCC